MIISFYPGGGGNRYLQLLSGGEWKQPGVSYDHTNLQKFEYRYLLSPPALPDNTDNILTHCINSTHIKKIFPEHDILFIKTDLKKSLRREWILHGHKRYLQKIGKVDISRLEHYNKFKDYHWPDIVDEHMIDSLPTHILKEVIDNYNSVVSACKEPKTPLETLIKNCTSKLESSYENITWHQNYYKTYPEDFSMVANIIDVDTNTSEFARVMRNELNLYCSELFDGSWAIIYE